MIRRESGRIATVAAVSAILLGISIRDARAELSPLHTSADSGFQVLRAYKGKVFGGTYGEGRSRIYRITKDELVEEAAVDSESVSVLALCPAEACIVANLERLDKSPTAFRRDDGSGSWQQLDVGHQYPEEEKSMGIGGGTAGGRVWVAVTPYVPGQPARGYVWSSADGQAWSRGPDFDRSIPMAFADFQGKAWTATIYGDDANGIYHLEADQWKKHYDLPDLWVSDMLVFKGDLYVSTDLGVYRMNPQGEVSKVTEFGGWMAAAKDVEETEWLYTGRFGGEWRCSGAQAEVWRTRNGAEWELYQRLPECEFQGVAALHGPDCDELFVATRQEGGHGRVYYEKFQFAAPRVCTPGEKRCGGGNVEQCGADGRSWLPDESCSRECSGGTCVAEVPDAGAPRDDAGDSGFVPADEGADKPDGGDDGPAAAGCIKDTDCKGDRICEDGRCAYSGASGGCGCGSARGSGHESLIWLLLLLFKSNTKKSVAAEGDASEPRCAGAEGVLQPACNPELDSLCQEERVNE